jgi:quinohemoprotein ethanol dehydrogenase
MIKAGKVVTAIWFVLSVCLALTACHRENNQPTISSATQSFKSTPIAVNAQRLADADSDSSNWLTHGRTYSEQRFSPLEQINTETISNLKLAWSVDLGQGERGQASTPLIVDGVMYVTTSWSRVMAMDAATGKVLWRYDPKAPGEWGINACCDVVNRGAAFWEGKVYVGTLDGRLVALDAVGGKLLWERLVIDRAERASITGAPRVIKGRVFIGSAGGEFGVRGRMTAVDANTGAILWRLFTIPRDPSTASDGLQVERIEGTWTGQWWKRGGGGTVWDAMSYDAARDLMYIGTGNGSPWPQSVRSPKGGDNLFVSSIIALRPETGEYVWHYQTTPGDEWGFDAASQLILAELNIGGQLRSVIMQAAANGFFYVIDRETGQLLSAEPFVPVNWASKVDLATGRPIESPAARYSKTKKPFDIQPGPQGAHSWHPMSFNPRTGLVYIPAMENAATLSVDKGESPSRYALTRGTRVEQTMLNAKPSSHLSAWDPIQQKEIWRVQYTTPSASGVLATAGGLVFQGSALGQLFAFHAESGQQLWKADTQSSVTTAPVTYQASSDQFVAVVVGAGGAIALAGGQSTSHEPATINTPRILAYSLNGKATLPPPRVESANTSVPVSFGTPKQVSNGAAHFSRYCARCHGENAVNAGPLKDLRQSSYLGDSTKWQQVVYAGLLTSTGMPGFMAEINAADAESVRAFVVAQANQSPSPPTN